MCKTSDILFGDENPLDRMAAPLKLASIFRTIACVGDSLSSGEFEVHSKK